MDAKYSGEFPYGHEELGELYRVAQRMFSPKHLRTNPLNMEIDPKKHLEWGQVFMMLATVAIQMNIDADRALEMAITHTDSKCEKKRDNRYGDVNKERIVRDEDK